jgi:hypothetical protein
MENGKNHCFFFQVLFFPIVFAKILKKLMFFVLFINMFFEGFLSFSRICFSKGFLIAFFYPFREKCFFFTYFLQNLKKMFSKVFSPSRSSDSKLIEFFLFERKSLESKSSISHVHQKIKLIWQKKGDFMTSNH